MFRLKRKNDQLSLILLLIIVLGCARSPKKWVVSVKNESDFSRKSETVTVPFSEPDLKPGTELPALLVKDVETGIHHLTQRVDLNGDSVKDAVIFQVNIPPHSEKNFELVIPDSGYMNRDTSLITFSRFVPERIDDYAWENDRVAFRTYGPEAERLAKKGEKGGTLSSGIDCWLKRVSYPVIDRWYKMEAEGSSYHIDHGEGLDNYQVGNSRGCGGIGVRKGDTLYVSDNFISYKTLEKGPLRTVFELEYAPWDAAGVKVCEKKRISLDLGSNLSRIEVQFAPPYPEEIVAGLAIPPGKEGEGGTVTADEKAGWFSFWSEHGESELGIGIVASVRYVTGYTEYRVPEAEKSHLFVHLHPIDGKVVYYTGFGWKDSNQYETRETWEKYLQEFASELSAPLAVKIGYY